MRFRATSLCTLAIVLLLAVSASATTLYSNGPVAGLGFLSIDAFFGDTIADSFTSTGPATITGFDAGIWTFHPDVPTTIDWTIAVGGPTWLFGTAIASGTGTWSNTYLMSTSQGYDIYTSTISGLNVPIGAGNDYWLQLSNGQSVLGFITLGWDENGGPSFAYSELFGQNPSEAFDIYGVSSATPEPGTILMFGSGLVGVAGIIRRRLS